MKWNLTIFSYKLTLMDFDIIRLIPPENEEKLTLSKLNSKEI